MKVNQVYEFVNAATQEALGETGLTLAEDLSNVVDVGTAIENARGYDNFTRALTDHIGRVIVVNRVYTGTAPSVYMDGWEYGSIMEKISTGLPEATENEDWNLNDGQSYDPNIFTKPEVLVKYFNKRITFEIPLSITEDQVKSAFSSAVQLNAFVSMLYTAVENSLTVKMEGLIRRTINNMVAETVYSEYSGGDYTSMSGVRAVNLLKLYKDAHTDAADLTAADAVMNPDFIRYAAFIIKTYADNMRTMSTVFNVGHQPRHTPTDRLNIIMLSRFAAAADVYLQSDTFHNELTALPTADRVPYWQGSGTKFDFADVSTINVKLASDNSKTVNLSGVLCVMHDRDALGVTNLDRKVNSNYVARGSFWNYWYKMVAGYFNDLNENCVVFFAA